MQVDRSMTEERCEVEGCNEADFLSTKCNKCKMQCCSAHLAYDAHNCRMNHDSKRHQCPICQKFIAVPTGESADRFVSAHIDSGCRIHLEAASSPTTTSSNGTVPTNGLARLDGHAARLNYCSFRDCTKNEDILIKCPKCGQSFCIAHRSPIDHQCSHSRPTPPPQPVVLDPTKPLAKRTVTSQLAKRKFSNTRATAHNLQKIEDGITIAVFAGDVAPFWITFQRRNPIGLALDKLCKAANVPNRNNSNVPDSEKWFVFCLTSAKGMPVDMALDPSMTVEEVAADGDVWYVGQGPQLPEAVVAEVVANKVPCTSGRAVVHRSSATVATSSGGKDGDGCFVS